MFTRVKIKKLKKKNLSTENITFDRFLKKIYKTV